MQVLATSGHVGIEFERTNMDVCLDIAPRAMQRFLKAAQADDAPRATDVGNKVYLEPGHGVLLRWVPL
jgi:hypothetical protein